MSVTASSGDAVWSEVALTLVPLVPVRVESEPNGGRKFVLVSAGGIVLCKTPSDRKSDRALAEAMAASINATAKALC